MRTFALAIAILIVGLAAACDSRGPTTPSAGASQATTPAAATGTVPSSGETFAVTGLVTDDRDAPVAGARVTMRYSLGGMFRNTVVTTDASGGYTVQFTSSPFRTEAEGRSAARAEIIADGFDWFWRNVPATNPRVENFRLRRINHIKAGGSTVVPVSSENGSCLGWLYPPCGRARVTVPADGELTLEALSLQQAAGSPVLEACCVSGNEVGGNPVTMRVPAGMEVWVEVGQRGPGVIPSDTVEVKTSFQPF